MMARGNRMVNHVGNPAVAIKKIISRRKLTRAVKKNLALVRLAKKTRKQ